MIEVKKLVLFFNKEYPFAKAEEWDKVGLLHNFNDSLSKVLICLDIVSDTIDFAIDNQIDLIITHHPFIFGDDIKDEFKKYPYKKSIFSKLKKHKISVITLHTNYDNHLLGMSESISQRLSLRPLKTKLKYGNIYHFNNNLKKLSNLFTKAFNLEFEKHNYKDTFAIKKFGIIPGSGSPEDILKMKKHKVDLVITSDIKWSTWIFAKEEKINLLPISHKIEEVFIEHIIKKIEANFKNLEVQPFYLKI